MKTAREDSQRSGSRERLDADASPTYKMEEVVRRTNLTPRAIRYYEELGLLRPSGRTAGGFRLFTEADIAQLMRINELQTLLGFSLAEIKQTLQVEAMRAEVREAYTGATNPAVRQELLERAYGLIQAQVCVIDERVGRLLKLREEHAGRLNRIRELGADAKRMEEQATAQTDDFAEAGKQP